MVLPWKPPQKLTNSYLPVWHLARRSALSTASAPPEYSCSRCTPGAGGAAAIRSASSTRAFEVNDPTDTAATCSCTACTNVGCECPSAFTLMPPMKSR